MQNLTKGSIFKYHNRVLKVTKTAKDHIIGVPFFAEKSHGNLAFRIPMENIDELEITEIATKTDIRQLLKNLTDELPGERSIFVMDKDQSLATLPLELAMEAIKGLADEKSLYKQNFSSNKSMRLKELIEMTAKEIGASLKIDIPAAKKMINASIDKRLKNWQALEETNNPTSAPKF